MRRVMGIKSNIFLKFLIFGKKYKKSKRPKNQTKTIIIL